MKILDVGCGHTKTQAPGDIVVGVDIGPGTEADIVHDLNGIPWPFDDGEFDEVVCNDVLEHLDDLTAIMREIHRVAKPGATVRIQVPYFTSVDMFTDPTHKRFFSARTLDYYCGRFDRQAPYAETLFRKRKMSIEFWRFPRLGGIQPQKWFGLGILANRLTRIYECFFAWILPAQAIRYEMEVVKEVKRK